jgi:hypothetical protein
MVGSEAVIGLPDTGEVQKYDLNERAVSGIVPMVDERQTLIDASITQTSDSTTLKFTKILVEDGEIPIEKDAKNTFLSAWGTSNILGFHAAREPYYTVTLLTPDSTIANEPTIELPADMPAEAPADDASGGCHIVGCVRGVSLAVLVSSVFVGSVLLA